MVFEKDSIYRSVVEDQTELIRRFQPDGRLTFVNRAFCRFYGMSEEGLLASNFQELLAPEEREDIVRQVFSLSPDNPEVITEPSYTDENGGVHYVQYVTRALFDGNGNVVEYQSVGRDVTEQRKAEATLAEARSAMERASRVTTFAVIGGGIAHEINQPLNAIRLLSASALLLEDRSETPNKEVVRMLQKMSEQVDRIDSIVNHLREHLRNNQNVSGELCNLGNAVQSALSLLSAQMIARGIKLDVSVSSEIKFVRGTCIRFEELLMNLLANAMQALDDYDESHKTISIRVALRDADSVELCVADNGPGFDPKLADELFEPFFSTKSPGSSMGLGLSIVRTIVQSAGGYVRAENRPEGGALLRVVLPVVDTGGI
ncbi:ATP-binding protein [Maridesulfovibrio sp.]|uniref:PAS domain-containing sensor histidine kinase n=1 Tax=Maridesulfovibrio sp. TaxID=2795000 RepID=UPI0029F592EE|nr:ATP-binding protein [Maridesulfovibrio sp.]